MTDSTPDDVALATITEKIKALLNAAFERGVAAGRQQMKDELASRMLGLFESTWPFVAISLDEIAPHGAIDGKALVHRNLDNVSSPSRAPRGSVEPKVYGALQGSVKGKKPAEIAAETGVRENSVRAMLNKLKKEGRVFKTGDVWRSAEIITEPDGSRVQVTPKGKIISFPDDKSGNGNSAAGAAELFK